MLRIPGYYFWKQNGVRYRVAIIYTIPPWSGRYVKFHVSKIYYSTFTILLYIYYSTQAAMYKTFKYIGIANNNMRLKIIDTATIINNWIV